MRVSIVTWDGGGNEPPALGLAEALSNVGHRVLILGYETQRERIGARDLTFASLARASEEFRAWPSRRTDPALVMASDAQCADVDELLRKKPPDVVVIDCLLFGALAAAQRSSIPAVTLIHSPPGCILPRGGLLDAVLSEAVAALRQRTGLPAVPTLQDAWVGKRVATTIPEMDPQPVRNAVYVGPVAPRPRGTMWRSPWPPSERRPLVVASFTTWGGWDQRSRIARTLEALADAPVRLLITTGRDDVSAVRIPPNATVAPFVPHHEVLPSAALVVTHGGHGTVMSALAAGLPVLCIPNALSDQPAIAGRLVDLGAGLALDGDTATAAEIRDAAATLLSDPSYASAARRLQGSVASSPGVSGAAEAVISAGARL